MLRITTRDVGATQVATIWVGEVKAVEFFTGTRHADYSKEIAERVLATAILNAVIDSTQVQIYEEDEY